MFKIFKSNNNTAVNFLQKKDSEIANAYRANNATKLNTGFTANAARYIANDIRRSSVNSRIISGKKENTKYTDERFISRNYEVISENDSQCVIKRIVNFKAVEVSKNLKAALNDSFAEIFTIDKTDNGFVIANICAA